MRNTPGLPLKHALLPFGARLLRLLPGSTALGLARRWRDIGWLAQADVAFVSFPKSGRTFVRAMLARLYQKQFGIDEGKLLEFSALSDAPADVPRIVFTHDGNAMRRPRQIRIDETLYEGCRIALLARHPGDIAVSRYHHLKHRSRDPERRRLADASIEEFVWTEQGGIMSIVAFLNGWAKVRHNRRGVAIFRYEDFRREPIAPLRALADFVGLSGSEADVEDAAEFARFENLREKERAGYFSSARLRPRSSNEEGSFKVRSGTPGGFRTQLDEAGRARVESYVAQHLDPIFGYRDLQGDRSEPLDRSLSS